MFCTLCGSEHDNIYISFCSSCITDKADKLDDAVNVRQWIWCPKCGIEMSLAHSVYCPYCGVNLIDYM